MLHKAIKMLTDTVKACDFLPTTLPGIGFFGVGCIIGETLISDDVVCESSTSPSPTVTLILSYYRI